MIALPLIFGRPTAADYEDALAKDRPIDVPRAKIECVEDPHYTNDDHNPEKRSIANAPMIEFNDDSKFDEVAGEYPRTSDAVDHGRGASQGG